MIILKGCHGEGAEAPRQIIALPGSWVPLRRRTSPERRYLSPLAKLQISLRLVYTFIAKKPFHTHFITFFKYILSKIGQKSGCMPLMGDHS